MVHKRIAPSLEQIEKKGFLIGIALIPRHDPTTAEYVSQFPMLDTTRADF